jgi:hypothetical protein
LALIAVLIPIGDFPFFVRACRENILRTCGLAPQEVELIFLVAQPSARLRAALHGQRVLEGPYEPRPGVHLELLDWAFWDPTLPRWVFVQHPDMFWLDHGWLARGVEAIANNPHMIALTVPKALSRGEFDYVEHKYSLDGLPLMRTHDFAGFYNRTMFLEEGFTFRWGSAGVQVPLSPPVMGAMLDKRLHFIHRGLPLCPGDFLDGSDTIGLEIALRFPGQIADIPLSCRFHHCWDLFGASFSMSRIESTLLVDRPLGKMVRSLSTYSWVSSHLFDRDQMWDKIFPWTWLKQIARRATIPPPSSICGLLASYGGDGTPCGDSTLGVGRVSFRDRDFSYPIFL